MMMLFASPSSKFDFLRFKDKSFQSFKLSRLKMTTQVSAVRDVSGHYWPSWLEMGGLKIDNPHKGIS